MISFSQGIFVNTILTKPNLMRLIFYYFTVIDLELYVQCVCKQFKFLYNKFVREEKEELTQCLKNKNKFFEKLKKPTIYFTFFEKRFWIHRNSIEYVNVDSFSENLYLFPKNIRQIIFFEHEKSQYKYILFKNGSLSILTENENNKFILSENEPNNGLNENILYMSAFGKSSICVKLYKIGVFYEITDGFKHIRVFHQPRRCPILYLKNHSGFLKLHVNGWVTLVRYEKEAINGLYQCRPNFGFYAFNVKSFKSKHFEHFAENVQYNFYPPDEN